MVNLLVLETHNFDLKFERLIIDFFGITNININWGMFLLSNVLELELVRTFTRKRSQRLIS